MKRRGWLWAGICILFASEAPAGYAGNGLAFDGSNDSVDLGSGAELALTSGAFTVEAWVHPAAKANICTLLGRRNSGAANPGYALYINTYDTADRRLLFETEGAVAYSVDPALTPDEWQHIALTWDASDLRMYVNGGEVSTTGTVNLTDASVNARIGAMASGDYFYEGRMDEMRIWSTNRSQAEIRQYMGRPVATNAADLTAYYRFDHDSGTQLDDLAGAGHDGTLTGMTDDDWIESTAPLADFALETNAVLPQVENLSGFAQADAGWGDYDGDGQLDIALGGRAYNYDPSAMRLTEIMRNAGGGSFTNIAAGLDPVRWCSVEWSDVDGDNDLDLFVGGIATDGYRTVLYRNDLSTGGGFSATQPGVTNVVHDIVLADFDGDGDMDAVTTASSSGIHLWQQDAGVFSLTNVGLPETNAMRLAVGDYDNDGDPDLACGRDEVYVLRNDLSTGGGFSNRVTVSDVDVTSGRMVWGDLDGDGDLDLAASDNILSVVRNDVPQGGGFTEVYTHDPSLNAQSVALGDYDNDGDLDIVVSGIATADDNETILYRNEGGFSFTPIQAMDGGGGAGNIGWGDYDNDGDLDLLIVGDDNKEPDEVYRNECPVSNSVPEAPSAIRVEVDPTTAPCGVLRWSAASDAETPAALLQYNVRIYDTAASNYPVSPMADAVTGLRRVPANGNRFTQRWIELNDIVDTGGVYHAAAQAIDTAWAGGPWSREITIEYGPPPTVGACELDHIGTRTLMVSTSVAGDGLDEWGLVWGTNSPAFLSGGDAVDSCSFAPGTGGSGILISNLTAGATYEVRSYARRDEVLYYGEPLTVTPDRWSAIQISSLPAGRLSAGDYDNDGDLDLAAGKTHASYEVYILRNDHGAFTNALTIPHCGGEAGVDWGDIDNDGDLDLLAGGDNDFYGLSIFLNDVSTGGGFTFYYGNTNASEDATINGYASFVDYDSDGRLDFMSSGGILSEGAYLTRLFRNDNGVFTNVDFAVEDLEYARFDLGDYDSDGDPDLAINGQKTDNSYIGKIYRNDTPQGGGFTNSANLQTPTQRNPVKWGDFDGDGDLDLLQQWFNPGTSSHEFRLYRNDGADTFTAVTNTGLPVLAAGGDFVTEWGDADNDGDLDLLFYANGGSPGNDDVLICMNQGDGTFTNQVVTSVFEWPRSEGVWGDFDNDGDLDAVVAFSDDQGNSAGVYLFRNNLDWGHAQTVPTAPNGLNSTSVGANAVALSWNTATDTETPAGTLSYNLRVGEVPEGGDALAGNADAAGGWRRLSGRGNAELNTNWILRGLSPGYYYWSVQSVDNQFSGSAWSTQATFRVGNVWLIKATVEDHGAISPSGIVVVADGGSTNFAITADTYWHVADVTTNGASFGAVSAFTWSNVTADATIHADFAADLAAGGTPHWWLAGYGLTNGGLTFDQAETNNPDNDPFTSRGEYIADTDPMDSNDRFRITEISVSSSPAVSFVSSSNRIYTMIGCSNLTDGAWVNVRGAGPRMGMGGSDSMQDTNQPPAGPYYRLNVELP